MPGFADAQVLQGGATILQDLVVQTRGLPGLNPGIRAYRRLDGLMPKQLPEGLLAAGMLLQKQLGTPMPELVEGYH